MTVSLHRGFFIIVLDLRLTKWVRGCREIAFNFFICFIFLPEEKREPYRISS